MIPPLPADRDADAWQLSIWNLPDDFVSRPQKLQLMLILEAAFNEFDPFVVVADLLKHRELWQGVVMDRGFLLEGEGWRKWPCVSADLIKLRDVGSDCWNVDTLFILVSKDDDERWQEIVEGWNADEVGFIEDENVSSLLGASDAADHHKILTVWWD